MIRFAGWGFIAALGCGLAFAADPSELSNALAYRCVHLEEDSPLESIQIFKSGTSYFASFRYLSTAGEFVEKKTRLTFSRRESNGVEILTFVGNGLTVDLDQNQPISPGKFSARIYIRDLPLETEYAACKTL